MWLSLIIDKTFYSLIRAENWENLLWGGATPILDGIFVMLGPHASLGIEVSGHCNSNNKMPALHSHQTKPNQNKNWPMRAQLDADCSLAGNINGSSEFGCMKRVEGGVF